MSASNYSDAEDPGHALEVSDRRDAKRWRKLRAMDPGWLAEMRDPDAGLSWTDVVELLADRDHHFARAEAAEAEAAQLLADLAEVTDERNKQRARAEAQAAEAQAAERADLRTHVAASKGELIR